MSRSRSFLALAVLLVALVTACNDAPEGTVNSAALAPADKALADIYNRSCRSCHTIGSTGAPLTGDKAAWDERMAKGMDTLVNSVVSGSGGMPPFGLCMDCDVEQFEALILFMAEGQ